MVPVICDNNAVGVDGDIPGVDENVPGDPALVDGAGGQPLHHGLLPLR